jgi:hypothetical protein
MRPYHFDYVAAAVFSTRMVSIHHLPIRVRKNRHSTTIGRVCFSDPRVLKVGVEVAGLTSVTVLRQSSISMQWLKGAGLILMWFFVSKRKRKAWRLAFLFRFHHHHRRGRQHRHLQSEEGHLLQVSKSVDSDDNEVS